MCCATTEHAATVAKTMPNDTAAVSLCARPRARHHWMTDITSGKATCGSVFAVITPTYDAIISPPKYDKRGVSLSDQGKLLSL